MNGKQLAQVAGLCVTLAGPALADTAQPLRGPATVTARLEAGQSLTWPLDLDQGTYVTGTLDTEPCDARKKREAREAARAEKLAAWEKDRIA